MRNKTSIIIAQRLSTVRQADKVFVMENGRIAAQGVRANGESPHDQLLKESGLYAEIFYRQLRPEAEEEAKR